MKRLLLIAAVVALAGCSTPKPACGVSSTQAAVEPVSAGSIWQDADGRIHIQGQTVTPVREQP